MKKLCGCIFFLVLFFSCTKDEKTTVQQEAVSPKVARAGNRSMVRPDFPDMSTARVEPAVH